MQTRIEALQKNDTLKVVSFPKGKRPVGCKYMFTIKHKADGRIDRYKARSVAKGYIQTLGVNYQKTFAIIRVLLSLAFTLIGP